MMKPLIEQLGLDAAEVKELWLGGRREVLEPARNYVSDWSFDNCPVCGTGSPWIVCHLEDYDLPDASHWCLVCGFYRFFYPNRIYIDGEYSHTVPNVQMKFLSELRLIEKRKQAMSWAYLFAPIPFENPS
jgi:hypothetical protein